MINKTLQELKKTELIEKVQNLEAEIEYKDSIIEAFKRQVFGAKSERFVEEENLSQLSLFEENNELDEKGLVSEEETEDISYSRKKMKGRQPKDLSHLPTREEIIAVIEEERKCPCCDKDRPFIGYDETSYINFVPAILELLIQKKEKYGKCPRCENCEPAIVIATVPNRIMPGIIVTEEVLAWICVCKVIDRQTLYHMEQMLRDRYKCPLSRQTMARWMIQLVPKLQPLVNLLKEYIWQYDVMWVDATSFQVLKTDKKPETKSYAYCAVGGPPGKRVVIFEYSPNHHGFLKDFLLDWKGYLHCDALNCYDFLKDIEEITVVLCNVHSRRKYEEITKQKKKSPVAKKVMQLYQTIYKFERQAKNDNLNPEQWKQLRQEKIKPIMEELKALVDEKLPITSESTRLHGALKYTYNNWKGFIQFLEDSRLDPDNNFCERMIKYFALARKNFLFADTVAGAEALTLHFSLLLTAQQNGLEPLKYYTKVLKEIPNCRPDHLEDYEALLPWNIKLD